MTNEIEFKFNSPQDSTGYLLGQLTLLWQRKHKKVLDPLNLTQTQFVLLTALAWLAKTNDHVTQMDIALQSNSDRMMVSKVLRTLEDKGYIYRAEHPTDTRAKVINITKDGAQALQFALTAIENADIEFFASLGSNATAFNSNLAELITKNAR